MEYEDVVLELRAKIKSVRTLEQLEKAKKFVKNNMSFYSPVDLDWLRYDLWGKGEEIARVNEYFNMIQ